MNNSELEKGFYDAVQQWNQKNVRRVGEDYELSRLARYFFWAGSTFGVQVAKQIYSDAVSLPETQHET